VLLAGGAAGRPYLHSDWNDPIAYVYSPAFLQVDRRPCRPAVAGVHGRLDALLLAAVRFLTGPRLLAAGLLFPFTLMEVAGGNISLLLAAAIVLGFRWPATWSLVLLTKITPGIGCSGSRSGASGDRWRWRSARRGRSPSVSFALAPDLWREWVDVVQRNRRRGQDRHLGVAAGAAPRPPRRSPSRSWSGARGPDRRWTVPVASMVALPALWYGGLSMLLGVIPLTRHDPGPDSQSDQRSSGER
jgi:hypothetical protein